MFKKVEVFTDNTEGDASSRNEEIEKRDHNLRQYIRKLEGKQLSDYVDRYTQNKADSNLHKFLEDKEKIKRETLAVRNMHPKELSPRQSILQQLKKEKIPTAQEQHQAVMDKYSKLNDGTSFKAKFYNILNEQVHKEGSFGRNRKPNHSNQKQFDGMEAVYINDHQEMTQQPQRLNS